MTSRIIFFSLIIFISLRISAQGPQMLWVEFNDKRNSAYSLNRPHEFLSQRAIERRLKQRIPLDFHDLPVSEGYVQTLTSDNSVILYYTSKWMNGILVSVSDEATIDFINSLDFVKSTEVIKPFVSDPVSTADATQSEGFLYNNEPTSQSETIALWDTDIEYGVTRNQIEIVNGQNLHQKGLFGKGLVVAVFDSGFSNVDTISAFNKLWNEGKILGHKDFVNPQGDVFRAHSHGTLVLSVMAAQLNDTYSGAATGASYWLLRTEDVASEYRIEEYNWLAAAEFADSVGVDVINSSLGYTTFNDPNQNYTYTDMNGHTTVAARAANMAFSRGMLVVTSAGNAGSQEWRYIATPGDAPGSLTIGATDSEGKRAAFSSVGPTSDRRIKPDVMAQGHRVAVINASGRIGYANGTSFSSPLIAAMAACLWQAFPNVSNHDIKHAIINSSDRYLAPDSLYGNGMPDFQRAFDILYQTQEQKYIVTLGPNPLQSESTLTLKIASDDSVTIELISSNGQRIWFMPDVPLHAGYNELKPFNQIEQVASGIYFIRMSFKDRSELIKAVKL
jgi:serine protease AprX